MSRHPASIVNEKDNEVSEGGTPVSEVLHSSNEETAFDHGAAGGGGEDRRKGSDSFGMPPYSPRYPLNQRMQENVLSVPWHLRKPMKLVRYHFLDFFCSVKFWQQTEFAVRITLLAVLLPASLIAAELPNSPFVSSTYPLSAAVLASKVTVGEGLAYLVIWIRAGCIWLPLATIGAAIHLGDYIIPWCFYYTIILFITATATENLVRRITLLLFNSCMIGLLVDPDRNAAYPSRVMTDWCIGTGLCILATFLPYPIFAKNKAQQTLAEIARNTGTALTGMSSCFWSETNVDRNMSVTKVRMLTFAIDELTNAFYIAQENSFYEFIFEGFEARETRYAKIKLFEQLRSNLRGLSRVLDIVESKPWVVDDSQRSKAFGESIKPHISLFSSSLDKLTESLASAKTFEDIKELHNDFLELNEATIKLQNNYNESRRRLFYEFKTATLEEFVPLMTFFMFSIINFRDTLIRFDSIVHQRKRDWKSSVKEVVEKMIYEPINEDIIFLKRLLTQWRRREVQRVIEAAKVSAAMILTVGFSFLIGIDKSSLSGPNIIAFVSGANPVEAVQASVVRLTACILGTVLGFFAGTYSSTPVEKVGSLCALMFIGTFFRNDKDYGIMAVYAMFVLIPLDTVGNVTTDDTIARMNQITFGILIYVFISIVLFPLSPSAILRKKRINILVKMSEVLTLLCNVFSECLPTEGLYHGNDLHMRDSIAFLHHGHNETSSHASPAKNLSTRLTAREDPPMLNIGKLLDDVEHRLKKTYPFMGFAREERGIVDADYPTRACEKTSYHLYRMISLLRTMWCSWDVLRSQKHYAPDTRHIFRHLQPIAWDVCRSFQRFVSMMCYTLRDPATVLETELIQAVLDLIQAADEMHFRKNQMLLHVINNSVKSYVNKKKQPDYHSVSGSHGPLPSSKQKCAMVMNCGMNKRGKGGDSILPLLRKGTNTNLQEMDESSVLEQVELSGSFVLPVTAEDAEGLHSLTLCAQMFADETKQLLMSMEEMLEHRRKRM